VPVHAVILQHDVSFRDEIDPISSSANSASTEPMQPSQRQWHARQRSVTRLCATIMQRGEKSVS